MIPKVQQLIISLTTRHSIYNDGIPPLTASAGWGISDGGTTIPTASAADMPQNISLSRNGLIHRENVHGTLNIITVLRNTPYCSQTPNSIKEEETSKVLPTVPTIQGIKEWCPQMARRLISCWKVQTSCIHFTWSSISYHGTKAIPHHARICTRHFWSS